ncbi:hypothetical protein OIE66_30750 [Nonomuraea sp. NBC_01738]|uniref:hypothetical protein n=1 Tax=Nonomuraea sp. NBC_01738 TaxID=2976003 RepID=UPI002E0FF016|nr:hypothetical protein OIE66_30750 [Nonomuraea sp. NBC_01738]
MHHRSVPAVLADLAAPLAAAAGYRAVMLVTDPNPDPDSGCDVPCALRVADDGPIPILTIGDGLLRGGPATPDGRIAAAAMAHALVCFDWLVEAEERRWLWLTRLATVIVVAGMMLGSVPVVVAAIPASALALLGLLAARRRSEYAVDRTAVRLLTEAGLDGPACLRELLADIAAHEPAVYRRVAWVVSGLPTAAARLRALEAGPAPAA